MKVQFNWRPIYPGSGSSDFQVTGVNGYPEFCCEEMREAWREQAIRFGAWHDTTKEAECVVAFWYWHCYPEGPAPTLLRIDFCPFCGAAIELQKISPGRP